VFSFQFHLKKFWVLAHHFIKWNLIPCKNFGKKVFILHFGFWPQEAKKKTKMPKYSHPPHEKFGILDGTKHIYENFGILRFIILK
jgi:hypothetical protein